MFDIGWTEILILAVISLFVIGPKDIPKFLGFIGKMIGKVKAILRNATKRGSRVIIVTARPNFDNRDLKKGGAIIKHNQDHRILMSFFIANLICRKNNIINDKSCVKTSYPSFFKHISQFSN